LDFGKEMIHLSDKNTGTVHSFHMDTSKGKPIIKIGDHNMAPRADGPPETKGCSNPSGNPPRSPVPGTSDLAIPYRDKCVEKQKEEWEPRLGPYAISTQLPRKPLSQRKCLRTNYTRSSKNYDRKGRK
jgi:hypothetical protein